jgi:HPt (histidine-containing phosphotransfer) domain-containing protein
MIPVATIAPHDIDERRLREMLDLVGPASETRLLQSLVGDLTAARAALGLALTAGDGGVVSAQSHVLSALAGTFGAPRLAAAALALERCARDGTPAAEGAEVLAMTDRLIECLSDRLPAEPERQK